MHLLHKRCCVFLATILKRRYYSTNAFSSIHKTTQTTLFGAFSVRCRLFFFRNHSKNIYPKSESYYSCAMSMFFESNEYIDHQRTTQSPIKSTRKIATRMHTKVVLDYESRRVSVSRTRRRRFFFPYPLIIWLQFGVSFHFCFERVLYKITTPSSSSSIPVVPLKKGLQVLFRVSPLLLPFSKKKKGTWQNQNTFRWLDTSRWGRRPTVYVKRHSF